MQGKKPTKEAKEKPASKKPSKADAQLEALQKELADAKDHALRTLAELENTRKRAERERAEAQKYGADKMARALLGVADNLARALQASETEGADLPQLIEGVRATQSELLRVFAQNGIEPFDPKGAMFDPNLHEAMFEAETADQPAGTIIEVVELGYKMADRLLRPARVGVAKKPA